MTTAVEDLRRRNRELAKRTVKAMATVVYFMIVCLALSASIAIWAGKSYMEARAYNRITGSNVSTWDAMFVDLRVQSEPKK